MRRKPKYWSVALFLVLMPVISFTVYAQNKKRNTPPKKTTVLNVQLKPGPAQVEVPAKIPQKKNGRPEAGDSSDISSPVKSPISKGAMPIYFYEFAQPNFVISKILIEHDEYGKGTIAFTKKGNDESISDPIEVSPAALERINNAFTALDFVNSNEDYQFEKDFSHLGSMKFRLNKEGRERTAAFNWTQNKNAKILADEYRKLGNQFIWVFDISVARENQPLEAPRLLSSLESLVKRNEISDAKQMIPFLKLLSDDERIPLIARNHAGKLVKQIEKAK